jgi:hypothetical protein
MSRPQRRYARWARAHVRNRTPSFTGTTSWCVAVATVVQLRKRGQSLEGAKARARRRQTFELLRDIMILMRVTGMRNPRELYRVRIENLDWQNRVIFVPDSKTLGGRRLVPMSRRVFELLRARCGTRTEGWDVPVQACCFGSPVLNRSPVSQGATASWCAERTGPLLCPGMTTALGFSCEPETSLPS